MNLDSFAEIISPLRLRILESLKEEKHPSELASEFKITRQAVDKHLTLLYNYGLVDKRIKISHRPMIFYRITLEGEDFLQNLNEVAREHILSLRKRYKDELFILDQMLVDGKIDEREYLERKRNLDKRFSWVMKV